LSLQKIPRAFFEEYFARVNEHNAKWQRHTLRETAKAFFREHVDEHGVRFFTLKLSEKSTRAIKPSKNVLKRWNLR
jgi:hypothetical protein